MHRAVGFVAVEWRSIRSFIEPTSVRDGRTRPPSFPSGPTASSSSPSHPPAWYAAARVSVLFGRRGKREEIS